MSRSPRLLGVSALAFVLTSGFYLSAQNVIKVCSDKNPQPYATPPHPVKSPPPEYSAEAREAKIEGAVVLGTVVGVDGNARDIRVVQSLGHGLDEKAIEAPEEMEI